MSNNYSFKYEVGMFGGCFDPLHYGHCDALTTAMSECKELYIILSYNPTRDRFDYKLRLKWLDIFCNHVMDDAVYFDRSRQTVKVIPIMEPMTTKSAAEYYVESDWLQVAENIKSAIGKHIDAVYHSVENDKLELYRKCYPDSKLVRINRALSLAHLSSTKIMSGELLQNLSNCVPSFVKKSLIKKVLVLGGECAGKSTFCAMMQSELSGSSYVEEYGKYYAFQAGCNVKLLDESDAVKIAITHAHAIADEVAVSNNLVFVDTDPITTSFYIDVDRKFCEYITDKAVGKFDLVIWLNPVNFVQDGTRDDNADARAKQTAEMKAYYSKRYKDIFVEIATTDLIERVNLCKKIIDDRFSSKLFFI